jgi:hypothetical protein
VSLHLMGNAKQRRREVRRLRRNRGGLFDVVMWPGRDFPITHSVGGPSLGSRVVLRPREVRP